jgi:hypothetical protein
MERASVLCADRARDAAVVATATRRRHRARRHHQAFVATATVVASLAVSTPAFAWPMCGC